ncbi:MAG: late competence development ComFB family protein [Gammaproteobacteria bacterium]|nr:late competence development ComFB family protein [Gammaproteobacteria bacterium]MCW8840893.1 late competence development ComFB family protein [Gammaproteobacteria bacterium]MCW8959810.1 late competence development ComFB family protein [Gammaproteobacteria bacterium]MCW8971871.1 late competence development ComFB family protein [Gammaproteobacteria bacterium]MCW8994126.1 late competence development ComFB family protein [Gammaproteobacteria bacterium]
MTFDNMHNYYEALVLERIVNTLARESELDQELLEDIACLALNQLPARYVRHDVDMALFLSTREREKMQHRVNEAVLHAAQQIREGTPTKTGP